jgi:hypothetical protein
LPSHPAGNGRPVSSRRRSSPPPRPRTTCAVPSVERSSRTSTSRPGTPHCASAERRHGSTRAASLRTGSSNDTVSPTGGGSSTGRRKPRRLSAVCAVAATARPAPKRADSSSAGRAVTGAFAPPERRRWRTAP